MNEIFIHYLGTISSFKKDPTNLELKYNNHIVFINDITENKESAIYTHGKYYGNIKEIIDELDKLLLPIKNKLDEEILRASLAEKTNTEAIDIQKSRLDILLLDSNILETTLLTLKKIQSYIESEGTVTQAMISDIHKAQSSADKVQEKADMLEKVIVDVLNTAVTLDILYEEVIRAKSAEEANLNAIISEIDARITSDNTLLLAVESEETRAKNAEEILMRIIDLVKNEFNTAIIEEATRAKNAEDANLDAINIISDDYLKSVDKNMLSNLILDVNNNKQDLISDLENIREGSELGKTALLSYTETDPIFTNSIAFTILDSDITNWNSKTSNTGTITEIIMNGSSKGTEGVIDLGTVITEHQDVTHKLNISDAESTFLLKTEAQNTYAIKSEIPTKISELENDSNYVVEEEIPLREQIATIRTEKQNVLVSGVDVKTINNSSILGSGNIEIITTLDIPTKLSQLEDDIIMDKYLPKTGGTISGEVTFQENINAPKYSIGDYNITFSNTGLLVSNNNTSVLSIINSGQGTKFLSDDNTYKYIDLSSYLTIDSASSTYATISSVVSLDNTLLELASNILENYITESSLTNTLGSYVTTTTYTALSDSVDTINNTYVSTNFLSTTLSSYMTKTDINSELAKKVNVVTGKLLSTEDFTTSLKDKLTGLSNYDDTAIKSSISTLSSNVAGAITLTNFYEGVSKVTSVSNIPITYRLVIATISTNGSLSLASIPSSGREIHVIIHNTANSDITVAIPNSGNYVNTLKSTVTVTANSYAEVNLISDGNIVYIKYI